MNETRTMAVYGRSAEEYAKIAGLVETHRIEADDTWDDDILWVYADSAEEEARVLRVFSDAGVETDGEFC